MTRSDLKPEFHGWQASDPTPQEKSEGKEDYGQKLKHVNMSTAH